MSAPSIDVMTPARVLTRIGQLAALAVLVGVVGSLVWANVTYLPSYVVQADGHATISDSDVGLLFSRNFWFVIIGLVAGIAVGVAAWVRLRGIGWPVAAVAAALALLAAIVCWQVGQLIGPGPFAPRLAPAQPGDSVPVALTLTTPSGVAAWVFSAVAVPLFAASLGPDPDHHPGASARRRPPIEDSALVGVTDD